jgi:hypothetical protein
VQPPLKVVSLGEVVVLTDSGRLWTGSDVKWSIPSHNTILVAVQPQISRPLPSAPVPIYSRPGVAPDGDGLVILQHLRSILLCIF